MKNLTNLNKIINVLGYICGDNNLSLDENGILEYNYCKSGYYIDTIPNRDFYETKEDFDKALNKLDNKNEILHYYSEDSLSINIDINKNEYIIYMWSFHGEDEYSNDLIEDDYIVYNGNDYKKFLLAIYNTIKTNPTSFNNFDIDIEDTELEKLITIELQKDFI